MKHFIVFASVILFCALIQTSVLGDPPTLKAGSRKVLQADGLEYTFCWCPAGEYWMGSPTSEPQRDDDEKPHKVVLTRGFWMLETEVTQAMWRQVMGESIEQKAEQGTISQDLGGVGSTYPMYYVSWDDCQEFCRKLSEKLGRKVQLPTEAQWEYACRAGSAAAYAGDIESMAWFHDEEGKAPHAEPEKVVTHPVAQKMGNAWGLYDMNGNVWEWCSDWYDRKFYAQSPTNNPENLTAASSRVFRGGSSKYGVKFCRSALRNGAAPGNRYSDLGLRIILLPAEGE